MSQGTPELPAYVAHRCAMWDTYKALRTEEQTAKPREAIQITLPDGKVIEGVAHVTTPMDIASGISQGLAQACVVARVNGEVRDMDRPFETSSKLELIKFTDPEGEYAFWHSSAHVLGEALELKYKDARLCIGPPVEEGGFYYDVKLPGDQKVQPSHFKEIEQLVNKVIKQKQIFERLELEKSEALEMFKFNPYKVALINSKVPDNVRCTAYRCGPLIDLCRGPHISNTKRIKTMVVTKNSSSYWLGKAENDSLQRVYGMSFPDKKKMKEWKKFQEEAKERDHRKIGEAQKLFFFHQLSPGSCFFLPHGARIYNKLISFIQDQYRKRGYMEVVTPNVYNVDLWKTSGHYANYKDNMFMFKAEGVEFGLKPMNCPGHCVMFNHDLKSYRDLPIRFADFGVLHRNELSGALTGLTRVRRFQQDDAHIFCRQDQIEAEVLGVIDMLKFVYGVFGFKYDLMLSTRPAKYLGALDLWDSAESALARVLTSTGRPWTINEADGAFYGPKIDIILRDALNRKHQCATIQLDFQLPIRFDLSYKGSDGKDHRPVMVHRAILGSVERMIAVLIEHTAGNWPFWLSPRQCVVVPVDLKYLEYANSVQKAVYDAGYHCDVDDSTKKFNYKVRQAYVYNKILVVGPKESEDGTVTVKDSRTKQQQTVPLATFLEQAAKMTADYQ